ncbi:MAG: hypothetical protein ACSLFQ_04235 [Thermoanaerobaculia bacterium]
MTYAIRLADGRFGMAQAISAMMPNAIYVAVFRQLTESSSKPIPSLQKADVISLVAVVRSSLREWVARDTFSPAVETADFPNERLRSDGYVGAKILDAGIVADFLAAFHGIRPWNVMRDERYFDELLAPKVPRPSEAVLLAPEDRLAYRKREFGTE